METTHDAFLQVGEWYYLTVEPDGDLVRGIVEHHSRALTVVAEVDDSAHFAHYTVVSTRAITEAENDSQNLACARNRSDVPRARDFAWETWGELLEELARNQTVCLCYVTGESRLYGLLRGVTQDGFLFSSYFGVGRWRAESYYRSSTLERLCFDGELLARIAANIEDWRSAAGR